MFPEGKAPKVCLGNSDMVTLVAWVEFWRLLVWGEKGSKKFLALVDVLSGYLEVFWFVLPPHVGHNHPEVSGFTLETKTSVFLKRRIRFDQTKHSCMFVFTNCILCVVFS